VHKKEKTTGKIKATELAAASLYWIRVVQREIFAPEMEALPWNAAVSSSFKIARYNPILEEELILLDCNL